MVRMVVQLDRMDNQDSSLGVQPSTLLKELYDFEQLPCLYRTPLWCNG